MKSSPIACRLWEFAEQSIREGAGWFVIQSWVFQVDGLSRSGFTFVDELTIFCWESGCIYSIEETRQGKSFKVRCPEPVFWEYWLDRLRETVDGMAGY